MIGKSGEYVSNHVRLLRLPADIQQQLETGRLVERQARCLIPFVDQPDVLAAIERDRAANPWAYRTSDVFEQSVKRIAAG